MAGGCDACNRAAACALTDVRHGLLQPSRQRARGTSWPCFCAFARRPLGFLLLRPSVRMTTQSPIYPSCTSTIEDGPARRPPAGSLLVCTTRATSIHALLFHIYRIHITSWYPRQNEKSSPIAAHEKKKCFAMHNPHRCPSAVRPVRAHTRIHRQTEAIPPVPETLPYSEARH